MATKLERRRRVKEPTSSKVSSFDSVLTRAAPACDWLTSDPESECVLTLRGAANFESNPASQDRHFAQPHDGHLTLVSIQKDNPSVNRRGLYTQGPSP